MSTDYKEHIFTDRIRSMGDGCVLTGVCHSVYNWRLGGRALGLLLPSMDHWSHDQRGSVWSEGVVWPERGGAGCLVREEECVWSGGSCLLRQGRMMGPPHPGMATAAVSTHPAGMHCCL